MSCAFQSVQAQCRLVPQGASAKRAVMAMLTEERNRSRRPATAQAAVHTSSTAENSISSSSYSKSAPGGTVGKEKLPGSGAGVTAQPLGWLHQALDRASVLHSMQFFTRIREHFTW